jgi:uncharacterized protein
MLLDLAIADGHDVTALVRDPSRLSARHRRLTVTPGDALDPSAVRSALRGTSAVLIALGLPRVPSDPDTSFSDAVAAITAAMREQAVKRVTAIAGAGVLQDARTGKLRMESPDYPPTLMRYAIEHRRVFQAMNASDLDWTLICPPHMPSGLRTGRYRTAVDKLPEGGESVSAEDVAAFTYSALSRNAFVKKRVGIAY